MLGKHGARNACERFILKNYVMSKQLVWEAFSSHAPHFKHSIQRDEHQDATAKPTVLFFRFGELMTAVQQTKIKMAPGIDRVTEYGSHKVFTDGTI